MQLGLFRFAGRRSKLPIVKAEALKTRIIRSALEGAATISWNAISAVAGWKGGGRHEVASFGQLDPGIGDQPNICRPIPRGAGCKGGASVLGNAQRKESSSPTETLTLALKKPYASRSRAPGIGFTRLRPYRERSAELTHALACIALLSAAGPFKLFPLMRCVKRVGNATEAIGKSAQ
jgi:hypothetical protein